MFTSKFISSKLIPVLKYIFFILIILTAVEFKVEVFEAKVQYQANWENAYGRLKNKSLTLHSVDKISEIFLGPLTKSWND